MERLILQINGMVCENSVKQVCHLLEAMQGVNKVEVDTLARTTVVEHDERACAVDDVLEAVSLAGYQVDRIDLGRLNARDTESASAQPPSRRGLPLRPIEWTNQNLRPMGA